MLTVRRLIAVGGIFMLAAVFTSAYVLGEPARDAKRSRPDEKAAKDSDFVTDDATASRFGGTPLLLYQTKEGDRLFALQVQPVLAAAKARPRDLVVLVDTTASQAGGHLLTAQKLVEALVAKLGDDDRVLLRTVNIKSADLSRGFQPARKLDAALAALRNELPMGAADLPTALKEAVKSFDGARDRQKAIVYLGDGMSIRNPLGPTDVPALADAMLQDHIAFVPVPVGPRLDPTTLHGLASRTGGAAVRLSAKAEMATLAKDVLDTLAVPVLYGASIELPAEVADHYPTKLPPLRGDAPTLLVGHIKPTNKKLTYTLKGTMDGQELTRNVELDVPAPDGDHFFLAGMVRQWQNAKDQPALIRADRALAFALEQNQLASGDLMAQGEWALRENRYDAAAALFGQARDLDPTSPEAKAMADLVQKLRDGKITKEQLRDALPVKPKGRTGKAEGGEAVTLVLFEEADGDKPVAPPVAGDDILREAERRQKVEDQKVAAMVDDVVRQSMRALPRDPDAARDYLKRTLEAVRTDQELSNTTRERLSRRLEANLADVEIRGERIKEQQSRDLAMRIQADKIKQAVTQVEAMENRIRERMRVFHNLMNQGREDEAYRQAQDIRQDLINQGSPVPESVVAAYMTGEVGYNLREIRELRRVREERLLLAQLGVERSHIPFPDEPPIQFPPTSTWKALTDLRKGRYESSRLVGEVSKRSEEVSKLLNSQVNFGGFEEDTKLGEALDYLSRNYGIPFDVNAQAFKDESVMEDILSKPVKEIPKLKNVALSTVLRKVLERPTAPVVATWLIRNGTVEITTARYAALEKAIVAYPIADLVIPITNVQQQQNVLGPSQFFGLQGGVAGLGGLGGLGGGLAGIGGLGGLAGLGGGLAGLGGGLGGGVAGLAGIGGLQGLQGGMGGVNIGLGALGGTQAPLLVKMITQIVGEPDDWAPIDPLQLAGVPRDPGGQPDELDKRPYRNSLAFYPPALALVVKGSSRIQTRPTPPNLKPAGEGGLVGVLDKKDPGVKVGNAGDERPDGSKKKKPPLADADPKTIWQEAIAKGVEEPGLIIACTDFLVTMKQWEHAAEMLKANLRQGIIVRPWVYEALAVALRETKASAEEIERAEASAADLEPLDAQGFLKAARGMQELKHPEAALAFCRQAALLEPNVAGPYRDALDYAEKAKDSDALEWAATRLLARDWPAENDRVHEGAADRLKNLASKLSEGGKTEAGDKLLARLQEAQRRDLEITLVWQNGNEPADLDLLVEEPTGSTCSWHNRQTVGGGILLGGTVGEKKATYIVAEGFPGTYQVRVNRVFGHPLGDKAQLRIVRHKGTPEQREELVTVVVPKGAVDTKKEPVQVKLDGGRRTHVAEVPPPATAERMNTSSKSVSTTDAISQLQQLADPSGYSFNGGSPSGVDGLGATPEGKLPEIGPRDEVAYQTRVSPFATNGIDVTAQAVISADRRYVRFSLAPTFNVVTGTRLQPVLIRNPIIPGFPVP